MRLKVVPLLVIAVFLTVLVSTLQATALSIPAVTGGYSLAATSPSDDPATSVIEVKPGQQITVQATATLTYSGPKMMSPPVVVNTELHLLKGSEEVSTETQATRVASIALKDGTTYTYTGSDSIKVPTDAEPGTYTMNCAAAAGATWLGIGIQKSATQTYTVQVLGKSNPKPDKVPNYHSFILRQYNLLRHLG